MEIGEQIGLVHVFPGVSSLCAFGCPSGRVGIFDTASSLVTYSARIPNPVAAMTIDNESILYLANPHALFRCDTRENDSKCVVMQAPSEITSIAVNGTSISVTTKRNGILLGDGRCLQRKISENQLNPIPPSVSVFSGNGQLVVGYNDGTLVNWHFLTEARTDLEIPDIPRNRKLRPNGICSVGNNLAVGYSSGISVYYGNDLGDYCTFGQNGLFGAICGCPCLGDDFLAVVVDDSTILPCRLNGEFVASKALHGVEICSLSANRLMVCAADSDEDGYLAAFGSEAFGFEA